MLYKYNKRSLTYEPITGRVILSFIVTILLISLTLSIYTLRHINEVRYISGETRAIILKENIEFSPEKLKEYILELNIKYPHIVYAQAELESGHFTSGIFKENNNLFGLKEAKRRPTTSKGTDKNHAYYYNWRESVQDYAMFAAAYLKDIHNENEYLDYLKQNYAEDSNYVSKLKELIKKD